MSSLSSRTGSRWHRSPAALSCYRINRSAHGDFRSPGSNRELILSAVRALQRTSLGRVDEVKSIPDKAVAMEAYFRQAQNTEAEGRACQIRLRAERKGGELLEKEEKAKGGTEPGVGRRGSTMRCRIRTAFPPKPLPILASRRSSRPYGSS